jgi:hypothetical protein
MAILLSGCCFYKVKNTDSPSDNESFYPYPQSIDKKQVYVFVHGINGGARTTWHNKNGTDFYDLLRKDNLGIFTGSDVFVFGLPSKFFENDSCSIEEAAKRLAADMKKFKVTEYEQIIFVAHSMGGLITMQYLIDNKDVAKNVPLVFCYSTPQWGSSMASLVRVFCNNRCVSLMVKDDGQSPEKDCFLSQFRNIWRTAIIVNHLPTRIGCAYETKPIFSFPLPIFVVDRMSATCLCDGPAHDIDADHIDMVKPPDERANAYTALRDEVSLYHPAKANVFLQGQGAHGGAWEVTANVKPPPIDLTMTAKNPSLTLSQPATIKKVSVSFHTNDGAKHFDTWITTQVVCDDKSFAGRSEPFGMFPKESFNGPFTLPLLIETAIIDRFNARCRFLININPSSRDTWRFNSNLEILFSDESHIKYEWNNIQLDHNQWNVEFPLQLKD